jgi:hypothetical protein
LGKRKRERGGKGRGKGGGSVYSQPGIGVDGESHQNSEEGFQVSKRGVQEIRIGISKEKGIIKGIGYEIKSHTLGFKKALFAYTVSLHDC